MSDMWAYVDCSRLAFVDLCGETESDSVPGGHVCGLARRNASFVSEVAR